MKTLTLEKIEDSYYRIKKYIILKLKVKFSGANFTKPV